MYGGFEWPPFFGYGFSAFTCFRTWVSRQWLWFLIVSFYRSISQIRSCFSRYSYSPCRTTRSPSLCTDVCMLNATETSLQLVNDAETLIYLLILYCDM